MAERRTSVVRRARHDELSQISELIVSALTTFRGKIPETLLDLYTSYSADVAGRWGEEELMVVEAEGRLAGTIGYIGDKAAERHGLPTGWATFRTLAVAPEARGRGHGSRLVRYCIDRSRADLVPVLVLQTAELMADACRLYEREGFLRSPERDVQASGVLGFDSTLGDVRLIAYHLPLA